MNIVAKISISLAPWSLGRWGCLAVLILLGCESASHAPGEGGNADSAASAAVPASSAPQANTQSDQENVVHNPVLNNTDQLAVAQKGSAKVQGETADGPGSDALATLPLVDPGVVGPFKISSYTQGLSDSSYESAVVYYPTNAPNGTLPVTTLSGGYGNTKENMLWLAQHLASHGFVVLAFTPVNNFATNPDVWARGHKGAVAKLLAENQRVASPLAAKIDTSAIGISGFSMGGAGTVIALNDLGSSIKAAVPICPFLPEKVVSNTPVLFITGTADVVAEPAAVEGAFINSTAPSAKAFAKFAKMTHSDVSHSSPEHRNIARYLTAWYQMYLVKNRAYQTFLNGNELASDRRSNLVFSKDSDFRYQD